MNNNGFFAYDMMDDIILSLEIMEKLFFLQKPDFKKISGQEI